MDYKFIRLEIKSHVATLTLNTPDSLNAFTIETSHEILHCLEDCRLNPDVKVIALRGAGKVFSGGGNVKVMQERLAKNDLGFDILTPQVAKISLEIKKMPKPVVACVHGAAAGAAFNIVLACDLCISTEDCKFIQSFVNLGLIPDAGGLYLLSKAVGCGKAMSMAMLATPVTARQAQELGFVYKVCTPDTFEEEISSLTEKLANGPSLAYAKLKELLFQAQFTDFETYIQFETDAQLELSTSLDFKKGVDAFLAKQTPVFTGE